MFRLNEVASGGYRGGRKGIRFDFDQVGFNLGQVGFDFDQVGGQGQVLDVAAVVAADAVVDDLVLDLAKVVDVELGLDGDVRSDLVVHIQFRVFDLEKILK